MRWIEEKLKRSCQLFICRPLSLPLSSTPCYVLKYIRELNLNGCVRSFIESVRVYFRRSRQVRAIDCINTTHGWSKLCELIMLLGGETWLREIYTEQVESISTNQRCLMVLKISFDNHVTKYCTDYLIQVFQIHTLCGSWKWLFEEICYSHNEFPGIDRR
jgi:hypothetical protein